MGFLYSAALAVLPGGTALVSSSDNRFFGTAGLYLAALASVHTLEIRLKPSAFMLNI